MKGRIIDPAFLHSRTSSRLCQICSRLWNRSQNPR